MATNSAAFTAGGTVSLAVTGASGSVALSKGDISQQILVSSVGSNAIAFIKFGSSAVSSATTEFPIVPGTIMLLSVGPGITHAAAIGTAGTTLYFTSGQGE